MSEKKSDKLSNHNLSPMPTLEALCRSQIFLALIANQLYALLSSLNLVAACLDITFNLSNRCGSNGAVQTSLAREL